MRLRHICKALLNVKALPTMIKPRFAPALPHPRHEGHGACEHHVQPPPVRQEAHPARRVVPAPPYRHMPTSGLRPHGGEDDELLLSALEVVHTSVGRQAERPCAVPRCWRSLGDLRLSLKLQSSPLPRRATSSSPASPGHGAHPSNIAHLTAVAPQQAQQPHLRQTKTHMRQ